MKIIFESNRKDEPSKNNGRGSWKESGKMILERTRKNSNDQEITREATPTKKIIFQYHEKGGELSCRRTGKHTGKIINSKFFVTCNIFEYLRKL